MKIRSIAEAKKKIKIGSKVMITTQLLMLLFTSSKIDITLVTPFLCIYVYLIQSGP